MSDFHDRWALRQVIGQAGWIRGVVTRVAARSPAFGEQEARRLIGIAIYADKPSWARGAPEGVRYSHPDGTTGLIPWQEVPRILTTDDAQTGLF